MEFMVRYGISAFLIGLVWSVAFYDPAFEVIAVAVVVTGVLVKGKLDEN